MEAINIKPRLLVIIDSKSNEKKHLKLLNKYKVKFRIVIYGKGTAPSKILERLNLNEEEKTVIMAIAPEIMSKHIIKTINDNINKEKSVNEIAFVVPLSSATKYIEDFYKDDILEDIKMEENNKHLIITITNEGYAENVMTSAKKAGAKGGTIINGRGLETEKVVKFLGVTIEPEKDIVLILTDDEKKTAIMNKIVEDCGLKTPGAGICFSLPVENAIGLTNVKKSV